MEHQNNQTTTGIHRYFVWSRAQRVFHWINVISIMLLISIGVVLLHGKDLGISTDGKILLKTIHVLVGYVFTLNLIWRIAQGFTSKGFARWSKTLPFTKGYSKQLTAYKAGKRTFAGHNPISKLMIALLLLVSTIQAGTGLVLAGTDIYYPPFGQHFVDKVAVNPELPIKPYSKENINPAAYQEMRALRKPVLITHIYSFYILLCLIPLHIVGVIVAEIREKHSVTSSMVHGYKYLEEEPVDIDVNK